MNEELIEETQGVAYTAQELLLGILQHFAGTPPPWNPIYDLNADGFIDLKDLLLCLMSF